VDQNPSDAETAISWMHQDINQTRGAGRDGDPDEHLVEFGDEHLVMRPVDELLELASANEIIASQNRVEEKAQRRKVAGAGRAQGEAGWGGGLY